jgi:hypothetical protein
MKEKLALVKQFCLIQIQILMDREMKLRKELQDCKIQKEYLQQVLNDIHED